MSEEANLIWDQLNMLSKERLENKGNCVNETHCNVKETLDQSKNIMISFLIKCHHEDL